jgi:ABC-type transport system involved in cytochrome c biogenesis permease subunit
MSKEDQTWEVQAMPSQLNRQPVLNNHLTIALMMMMMTTMMMIETGVAQKKQNMESKSNLSFGEISAQLHAKVSQS